MKDSDFKADTQKDIKASVVTHPPIYNSMSPKPLNPFFSLQEEKVSRSFIDDDVDMELFDYQDKSKFS